MATQAAVLQEYLDLMFETVGRLVPETSAQLLPTKKPGHNYLGDDVEPAVLADIQGCMQGRRRFPAWQEAQLRELAFWRWVAFEGYQNRDPRTFRLLQAQFMLRNFMKTGWSLRELAGRAVVEIGCGPLGMIDFLPAIAGVAFDPLNRHYSRLFGKVRSPSVRYVDDLPALVARQSGGFDLGICFNVLDHTEEPRPIWDAFMRLVAPGGRFLVQVNTVRDGFPRTDEHRAMHPSPFSEQKISAWIREVCSEPTIERTDQPSGDNEFWFMAWGRKDRGS
jgi:SAM-dependent methyltransferase